MRRSGVDCAWLCCMPRSSSPCLYAEYCRSTEFCCWLLAPRMLWTSSLVEALELAAMLLSDEMYGSPDGFAAVPVLPSGFAVTVPFWGVVLVAGVPEGEVEGAFGSVVPLPTLNIARALASAAE